MNTHKRTATRKRITIAVSVLAAAGVVTITGLAAAAGPDPATTSAATTAAGPSSNYHAVTPMRVLDTRNGTGASKAPIHADSTIKLKVTDSHGVPATGVTAVTLNLTATAPTTAGFLTAYPDGASRPTASSINFVKNQTVANEITVAVGSDGEIDIYNHSGNTQAVADLEGYYTADTGVPTAITVAKSVNADGSPVVLKQVGGTIRTGVTRLTDGITLQPGTYQVTASGVFYRKAGTGAQGDDGVPNTYGTLVVWEDLNNDGQYDWNNSPTENAGTIQTGMIPRMTTDSTTSTIETAANQTSVITITKPNTVVYLGGFGYNDNTSNYGTAGATGAGDFSVAPSMTVQKLNVG